MKKLMMAVVACVCALGLSVGNVASAGELPDDYVPVEYIESTGAQYIKGVYTCTPNTRVDLDLRLVSTSGSTALFAGSWGQGWLLQLNGGFISYGGGYKSKYALYGMSIYERGEYAEELKRLFVPCYTNDNGTKVAGLYDVVNAKFYKNSAAGDDFVLGADLDNFVDIVGDPGEAGEPVCGSFVGYGRRTSLTDGEEVTCTMPETTIESPELGASLLGWKLEIFKGETLVSTTTNTVENVDTCTFTHQRGNFARLTWRWKSKYRVTVEATGGLDVSPAYKWVDGGEDVTFTATGGGAVWAGAGLDPRTHRSQTCKITNVTGPVTLTVSPPNVVYVSTNGVDETGRSRRAYCCW